MRPKRMATPVTSDCRPIILCYILSPWSYTALLPPWFSWVSLGLCDLLLHTGPNINSLFYSNDSRSLQILSPWVLSLSYTTAFVHLAKGNHRVSSRYLQQLTLHVQIEYLAHHHWLKLANDSEQGSSSWTPLPKTCLSCTSWLEHQHAPSHLKQTWGGFDRLSSPQMNTIWTHFICSIHLNPSTSPLWALEARKTARTASSAFSNPSPTALQLSLLLKHLWPDHELACATCCYLSSFGNQHGDLCLCLLSSLRMPR